MSWDLVTDLCWLVAMLAFVGVLVLPPDIEITSKGIRWHRWQ